MPMSPRLLRPKASTGFDPRTIAGLAVWLDASISSSVTLNSGNVSEWLDLSDNGRHAAQASASAQPSYSASALNGRNVVVAQDVNRRLIIPAFPAGLPQTVFVVASTNGTNQGIFQRGAVNSVHSLWRSSPNFLARRGSGNEATFAASDGYKVFTCVFTRTLARLFVGSSQGTDSTADISGTGGDTTENRTLALFALDTIFGMVGGIAEFLYYNANLSAANQATIRSYLSKKWNVML